MMKPHTGLIGVMVMATLLAGGVAFAARGGGGFRGGGARASGSVARGSVSQVSRSAGSFNRGANVNRDFNGNVNRNFNSNVNVNRAANVNRDINWDRDIDVDVNHRYGGYGYGCCYHPVARAATATAAAVATAAVAGSVVDTLPESCQPVFINGFTYQQCGSTWYQPQFSGSTVNYIVVNPPR
jgi:hypothetical protein